MPPSRRPAPERLAAPALRFALVVSIVLLAAGCGGSAGSPSGPRQGNYTYVAGEYCLASRDGTPMRVTVADSSGWSWQLVVSRLTLTAPVVAQNYAAGAELYTILAKVSPGGAQTFTESTDGPDYHMTGNGTFALASARYLTGSGALEISSTPTRVDTTVVITSTATATYGAHTWRYTKKPPNGCTIW